ncbi:hypothetical protein F383_24376 [Gossypium arboreum]|uniref:Uncharacterized protein n=1 Tax=Gossypium arboreum TaxID=29729 RepID=A0A0B0P0S3_GOSAR|nr:hypothetical protein F383_24376 [Gossypium arboreum]
MSRTWSYIGLPIKVDAMSQTWYYTDSRISRLMPCLRHWSYTGSHLSVPMPCPRHGLTLAIISRG